MDIENVLEQYLNRGFGSMNKNDFEVWIFSQLIQGRLRGMSNYDISIFLKIPETKVKRLKYEASLKYLDQDEEAKKDRLAQCIEKVHFKKDGNSIQFVVEDIFLRKFLDALLKRQNRFSDSSFNSEIVTLSNEDFGVLLDIIRPKNMEDILQRAQQKKNKALTLRGLFNLFVDSAVKAAGEKTVAAVFCDQFNLMDKLSEFVGTLI